MRELDTTTLHPAVAAHIDATAKSLESSDSYYPRVFRQRLADRHGINHWTTLPVGEQIAYVSLLSAAVQSCDDVECDPVATAEFALDAIRPLLRGR